MPLKNDASFGPMTMRPAMARMETSARISPYSTMPWPDSRAGKYAARRTFTPIPHASLDARAQSGEQRRDLRAQDDEAGDGHHGYERDDEAVLDHALALFGLWEV